LNSIKAKITYLSISTLLLFVFVGFSFWAPTYVESLYENKMPLEQRIAILENAIVKMNSENPLAKKDVVTFLENQIETEKANEASFNSIVSFFKSHPNVLLGLLFLHLASIISVSQALVQKKT
jgi:hypothetical protein